MFWKALTPQFEPGFSPVKVNAVLMRGINDDEIVPFLEMGRNKGVTVRFIEFMPLDAQGEWSADHVVPYDEILSRVSQYVDFEPVERGSSPAERFRYSDGSGEFGIIASVTEPFLRQLRPNSADSRWSASQLLVCS